VSVGAGITYHTEVAEFLAREIIESFHHSTRRPRSNAPSRLNSEKFARFARCGPRMSHGNRSCINFARERGIAKFSLNCLAGVLEVISDHSFIQIPLEIFDE
jgi:hypothetical protein